MKLKTDLDYKKAELENLIYNEIAELNTCSDNISKDDKLIASLYKDVCKLSEEITKAILDIDDEDLTTALLNYETKHEDLIRRLISARVSSIIENEKTSIDIKDFVKLSAFFMM